MRRRDFMIGAGAASLALGGLSRLTRASGRTAQPARRVLLVFAAGGWDTSYALDPKEPSHFDVPVGAVRRFAGLDVFTDASRPHVTEYFTRHAATTAIVRGIATDAINHNECQLRIATGSRERSSPDLGAMISHDVGNALPIPYLVLGDIAFTGPYAVGSARVGTTNQIVELVGPGDPDALTGPEDELLRTYAQASADRARATRGATGYNRRRVDDFAEAIDRSDRLRALGNRFGKRGTTLSLADQIPLALDAVQQDISHAVMMTTRLAWDTHADNALQAGEHDAMFAGLDQLVTELGRRPGRAAGSRMIDDTVVVVFSELGRTPRLNATGEHAGKDHWPLTSAMVIGAGVAGGRVFGSTAPDGQGVTIDLASGAPLAGGTQPMYSHFVAGVLRLCGVDPSQHFTDLPAFDAFIA